MGPIGDGINGLQATEEVWLLKDQCAGRRVGDQGIKACRIYSTVLEAGDGSNLNILIANDVARGLGVVRVHRLSHQHSAGSVFLIRAHSH